MMIREPLLPGLIKGTVISYSRKGYVISFDGCGPEENEVIYSLKQGIEKGEVKLL